MGLGEMHCGQSSAGIVQGTWAVAAFSAYFVPFNDSWAATFVLVVLSDDLPMDCIGQACTACPYHGVGLYLFEIPFSLPLPKECYAGALTLAPSQ